MILLIKLQQIAEAKGYFSHIQFGFSEGVGCLEASSVISECINQLLEKGGKDFVCFLDVRKAFDTVWIPGLLYKLKHELGIDSQLWLVIRELYQDVRGQVLVNGHVSDSFHILQGSGQGRILAPFLYNGGCKLQVARCRMRVAGCRLRLAGRGCRLPINTEALCIFRHLCKGR